MTGMAMNGNGNEDRNRKDDRQETETTFGGPQFRAAIANTLEIDSVQAISRVFDGGWDSASL